MKKDLIDWTVERYAARGGRPSIAVIFVIAIGLVIGIWMLWAALGWAVASWAGAYDIGNDDSARRTQIVGAWGDSFGGFNALFGALGFVALGGTLLLQSLALREQRRDQHLQRFESTFFELMDLMRKLREDLQFSQTKSFRVAGVDKKYRRQKKQTGFDAIKFAFYEVRHYVLKSGKKGGKYQRNKVAGHYERIVHKRYESRFAPYFRIVYTILYRIKSDATLTCEQQAYYGNLLRSQLTSYDVMLLAFNATSGVSKDLSDLLTYFRFLKYVPPGRGRSILQDVYPEIAFEARD